MAVSLTRDIYFSYPDEGAVYLLYDRGGRREESSGVTKKQWRRSSYLKLTSEIIDNACFRLQIIFLSLGIPRLLDHMPSLHLLPSSNRLHTKWIRKLCVSSCLGHYFVISTSYFFLPHSLTRRASLHTENKPHEQRMELSTSRHLG